MPKTQRNPLHAWTQRAPGASSLSLKYLLAMMAQEFRARFGRILRQRERNFGKRFEVLLHCRLRKKFLQPLAHHQFSIRIKRNQPGIECAVVQAGEAEAVLRI